MEHSWVLRRGQCTIWQFVPVEAAVIVTDNEKYPQAFPDASVGPPLPVENHRQICPYVQGGMEEQVWEP